jgi:hypothetical protein
MFFKVETEKVTETFVTNDSFRIYTQYLPKLKQEVHRL